MSKTKQPIINNLIHNPNKENRDKFLKELDSKIDKRIFNEINQQLEEYWKGKRSKKRNSGKFLDIIFDSYLSEYF